MPKLHDGIQGNSPIHLVQDLAERAFVKVSHDFVALWPRLII